MINASSYSLFSIVSWNSYKLRHVLCYIRHCGKILGGVVQVCHRHATMAVRYGRLILSAEMIYCAAEMVCITSTLSRSQIHHVVTGMVSVCADNSRSHSAGITPGLCVLLDYGELWDYVALGDVQRHDKDMVTRYTVLEPGRAMGLPSWPLACRVSLTMHYSCCPK